MGDAIWENRGVGIKPHPFLFGKAHLGGKEMDIWVAAPEPAKPSKMAGEFDNDGSLQYPDRKVCHGKREV